MNKSLTYFNIWICYLCNPTIYKSMRYVFLVCFIFFSGALQGGQKQEIEFKFEEIKRKIDNRTAFYLWYDHINRWEGRDLNKDIADVDGDKVLTNHGVRFDTWAFLAPKLFNLSGIELKEAFNKMTPEQHKKIAFYFWCKAGGNSLTAGRVGAICSESFWGGGNKALKNLQKAFNLAFKRSVSESGVMTAETIKEFNSVDSDSLYKVLTKAHYKRQLLIAKNPAKRQFLRGWINRFILGDATKRSFIDVFR